MFRGVPGINNGIIGGVPALCKNTPHVKQWGNAQQLQTATRDFLLVDKVTVPHAAPGMDMGGGVWTMGWGGGYYRKGSRKPHRNPCGHVVVILDQAEVGRMSTWPAPDRSIPLDACHGCRDGIRNTMHHQHHAPPPLPGTTTRNTLQPPPPPKSCPHQEGDHSLAHWGNWCGGGGGGEEWLGGGMHWKGGRYPPPPPGHPAYAQPLSP